ncbi:MAG: molybdopterin-dependent oxidoreductase, partial [Dehalococcoidia bacterium]
LQSPARLPEDLVKGRDNWFATLCRQCPSSEGVIVRVMEGRAKKSQGNPGYPVNWGKQSVRCDGGLQALYHPDRIAGPMQRTGPRGTGAFQPINWTAGLDRLKNELIARGDGMVLATEPLRGHLGLIASRFASSLGGQHLGFEALDQTTYRAAVNAVFGQDLLPDFDIANANRVISFGADFLSTWVSPTRWSVGYGEFRQGAGRESRGQLIQVDPRFSLTAANADRWLPVKPGTEGFLALSIASVIIDDEMAPPGVIDRITGGDRGVLNRFRPDQVGPLLELPPAMLGGKSASEFVHDLAHDLAEHGPSLAIGGDSAAAHSNGLFNLEAVYALNYLLGSVGQTGGVKFNPGSPLPDLPAAAQTGSLQDWRQVADNLHSGRTRLLLLHQADLIHGLPASLGMRSALDREREDLVIVSFSPFIDETSALADLILPDRVYLEDWGDDIPDPGPGYQVVGMQQPVVNPLADLDPRSFGDCMLSLAQELGYEAELPWNTMQEALKQSVETLFNLNRGTSTEVKSAEELWNLMLRQGGWWDQRDTGPDSVDPPDGLLARIAGMARDASFSGDREFHLMPFSHNSLLDGRNAHLPWMQAAPDPLTSVTWQTWVEINDAQAKEMGLREGDIARIRSDQGSIRAVVYPTPAVPPNVVGIPLGQGRRNGSEYATGGDANESSNVMDLLDAGQVTENGALAWAGNRVTVTNTGESLKISKFEGSFPAREIVTPGDLAGGERIIQTVSGDDHGHE